MLIFPIEISQTASSGVWSFNTQDIQAGILKQILVKSTTATTTFDVYVTDKRGLNVFDTRIRGFTPTGTLNELLELPLRGKYTVGVVGASTDDVFTGILMVQEK